MSAGELAAIVESFWQARGRGVHFPPEWSGKLSLDEAYRVQAALLARRAAAEPDARQVGWKVGLTARAIQEQFRVHEPVFGCILAEGVVASGHRFAHGTLIKPGFENEICVRLGRDLAGAGVDLASARAAVAACHPAFEITETRGDFTADLPLALADNAQQKAIVLGPARPLARDLDLAAIEARVEINGKEAAAARGEAVLGDPLNSLVWLARKLAVFGRGLAAGELVMTGSFTRQFPLAAGDRIRARFAGLGEVEAEFA
jgi:2-keto-4-pentenoate hydratase